LASSPIAGTAQPRIKGQGLVIAIGTAVRGACEEDVRRGACICADIVEVGKWKGC